MPASPVFGASAESGKAICDGDGVSGDRVQVLYIYAVGSPDRFNQFVDSFRIWAAEADKVYQDSARETGGHRYIRFVHDASCTISVKKVQVTATSNDPDNFFALSQELVAKGYQRADRKYLLFQDVTDLYWCGTGLIWEDDQPGLNNYNDLNSDTRYTSIAAIYSGCWDDGTTAAHELGHVFGGVQPTAPNASAYYHCTDEWDIMCYDDGAPMRDICHDISKDRLLDCNHDDYFHTNPPTGNYLKTHWNIANSSWLGKVAFPTGTMTFDKTSSKYNGVIVVSLSGFSPGFFINVKWPDGTVLAQVKAGNDGTATTSFRTPLSPLGNYQVRASNSQDEFALATLRVIPRILLNEVAGEAGDSIRVYFYGFAPGDKVEVRFYNEAETSSALLTTITIASNGRGSKVVIIPTSTTVGDHKIVGKVIGVARSASTYFEVTGLGTADDPTATPSATATATAISTETPIPTPELTATPEPTGEIVPTETPTVEVPTETPTIEVPTEEPAPTETPVPQETPTESPVNTPIPTIEPTAEVVWRRGLQLT